MNMMQVVCDNHDCDEYGKVKTLHPVHVSQGIYQRPDFICMCGHQVRDTQNPLRMDVNLPAQTPQDEGRPGAYNVNLSPGQMPLWENTDEITVNERLYRRVQADPGALY